MVDGGIICFACCSVALIPGCVESPKTIPRTSATLAGRVFSLPASCNGNVDGLRCDHSTSKLAPRTIHPQK